MHPAIPERQGHYLSQPRPKRPNAGLVAGATVDLKQGSTYLACDGKSADICEPGASAMDGMGGDLTTSVSSESVLQEGTMSSYLHDIFLIYQLPGYCVMHMPRGCIIKADALLPFHTCSRTMACIHHRFLPVPHKHAWTAPGTAARWITDLLPRAWQAALTRLPRCVAANCVAADC